MYRSLLYNLLLHIHRHALVAGADKRTLARGHLDFLALVLRSIGLDRLAQMLVAVYGKTIDLLGLFLDIATSGLGPVSYTHLTLPTSDLV